MLITFSRLLGCGLFPFSADVSLAAVASIIRAVDLNSGVEFDDVNTFVHIR